MMIKQGKQQNGLEVVNKMRLFTKNKTRAIPARADPVALWLSGGDKSEMLLPSGYTSLDKNEEIRRCTHKIADLVSSMTIMLMENGDNGDVRLHNELSKKIDVYPNSSMTRKNFIYKITTDLILTGNSVAYPVIIRGVTNNILPWDIQAVSFHKKGNGYIIKHLGAEFSPDELLHFSINPDGAKPFCGQGFTPMIKDTVENLLQANATKKGFLQSKWKPSLIISIASDAEELQDDELRAKILGSYTKTTDVGEPWLIPAGEIKVEKISPLTLKDLAIQESITLDKQAVAAAFGVPAFMVGVGAFNKDEYNNFISTTIMSFAMGIQQELTRKLLYSPKLYFKFNPKSLMQYALTEKVQFVKEMVSGGMLNRNEGRCEFDYAPVDNAGMNEFIVLENYVPVDRVGDQKKLKGVKEDV